MPGAIFQPCLLLCPVPLQQALGSTDSQHEQAAGQQDDSPLACPQAQGETAEPHVCMALSPSLWQATPGGQWIPWEKTSQVLVQAGLPTFPVFVSICSKERGREVQAKPAAAAAFLCIFGQVN